jgi:hypothetical protein
MPTLDDIPILQRVTPAGDDLIPISDPNGTGSSQVRAIALNQISGLNAGEVTTTAAGGTIVITTRVQVITGTTATTTLTLPAASGVLREVMVINDCNAGVAAATVSPALAAGNEAVVGASHARFLSNGTGWYRIG